MPMTEWGACEKVTPHCSMARVAHGPRRRKDASTRQLIQVSLWSFSVTRADSQKRLTREYHTVCYK